MISPGTKIWLVLMVGVLAVVLEQVGSLFALAVIAACAVLSHGVDRTWIRRGALLIVAVVWSTVVSQALFYGREPRTPWFTIGPLVFWVEGVEHGLAQSLRLLSVSLAGIAIAISTSPDRLFIALQRLGVPSGICFLAVTALRFIPTLASEVVQVRGARRHRGRPLWQRTPWAWVRLEVSLLRPAVARTLRRARALSESLDARGYDPHQPRHSHDEPSRSLVDGVILYFAAIATVGLVAARVTYLLYTIDLVYHPSLRGLYGWVRAWV
jgi:energy-coupling factor transport system permease protein